MRRHNKSSLLRKLFRILFLFLVLTLLVSALRGRFALTLSHYTLHTEKLTESIRIVHISDLHNRSFGKDNRHLLAQVELQKPDLIFVTGDCVTRSRPERQISLDLLAALTEIAPVYVSMGNHEEAYDLRNGTDLYTLYTETGARVLEKEYADITLKGQSLRVGGIYGYCDPERTANPDDVFLQDFQNTNRYTLLLCHRPVSWLEKDALEFWRVDSVFAGHAHGGQIRLPLIGAVIAPDQGFFPGWTEGVHYAEDGMRALIVSRGLGSSIFVPRIFNDPELVVVDISPAT